VFLAVIEKFVVGLCYICVVLLFWAHTIDFCAQSVVILEHSVVVMLVSYQTTQHTFVLLGYFNCSLCYCFSRNLCCCLCCFAAWVLICVFFTGLCYFAFLY